MKKYFKNSLLKGLTLRQEAPRRRAKVKSIEDEIKRDFLDPNPIGFKKENSYDATLGKE